MGIEIVKTKIEDPLRAAWAVHRGSFEESADSGAKGSYRFL